MQSVGVTLWNGRTGYFRAFRSSFIVPLSVLSVMAISISPALTSQGFAIDAEAVEPNGPTIAAASYGLYRASQYFVGAKRLQAWMPIAAGAGLRWTGQPQEKQIRI